jgi:predicted DNA-binding transcriptional regulator AlpA
MRIEQMTSSTGRRAASAAATQLPTCDRLWTFQDVSAFLGVPIGTLYQWRTRGEGPPAFKVGGHVRFDPDRVRAWLLESAA